MIPYIMCEKYTCPKAINCYRLRAATDESQLDMYNTFPGICNSDDNYQMFMKIRPDDKIIELSSLKESKQEEEGEDNLIAEQL